MSPSSNEDSNISANSNTHYRTWEEQDRFISSMLDLEISPFGKECQEKKIPQGNDCPKDFVVNEEISQLGPSQDQPASRKSKYHNFQKQIVTSLREIISVELIDLFQGSQNSCLLWKEFKNITGKKVMSRTFLITLFNKKSQRHQLKKYGFALIDNMTDSQLASAKADLLRVVIQILGETNIPEYIEKNRNIKRKQDFIAYFDKFEQELRAGKLKKRMERNQ